MMVMVILISPKRMADYHDENNSDDYTDQEEHGNLDYPRLPHIDLCKRNDWPS